MRWLLLALLCVGCADADRITAASKQQIKTGMTLTQVEQIIGSDSIEALAIGGQSVRQWQSGSGDNLATIVVRFDSGRVVDVSGSNLK